jgi:hypothetical protein
VSIWLLEVGALLVERGAEVLFDAGGGVEEGTRRHGIYVSHRWCRFVAGVAYLAVESAASAVGAAAVDDIARSATYAALGAPSGCLPCQEKFSVAKTRDADFGCLFRQGNCDGCPVRLQGCLRPMPKELVPALTALRRNAGPFQALMGGSDGSGATGSGLGRNSAAMYPPAIISTASVIHTARTRMVFRPAVDSA